MEARWHHKKFTSSWKKLRGNYNDISYVATGKVLTEWEIFWAIKNSPDISEGGVQ